MTCEGCFVKRKVRRDKMGEEKKKFIKQEDIMKMLDLCYDKSLHGIKNISPPMEQFADDYVKKADDKKKAVKSMQKNQIAKCTTSGFITGFGGAITMPLGIPVNITSVIYVQMRMVACTAYYAGYDLKSDQVKTFVYACLAGVSVNGLVKQAGMKLGEKMAIKAIKKIPNKALARINRKVGVRLITKFGEKGILNLGKMVPVVGAAINGGLDLVETKILADRAYKMFFEGDFSAGDKEDEMAYGV